ncbi:integral membrane protein [Penicillium angulare]|uniref:uncharacterized protein n=1 Tax=Penicillium angulare TaxID=116970 RepID=UPI00253FBF45|nr:uncharacterized protein N7478_000945 [Penicillium angulare]KAJ5291694.1 integral membrane protein [Penicillium angulare]
MAQSQTSSHSTTAGILAELYILFMIAVFLIGLRIWVRTRISKNWGWDDSFIIVAWVFLLIGVVLVQIEANYGMGHHLETLKTPESQALTIMKFNTFYQMDNVLCTLFTKLSISAYILRIKDSKRIRWVLGVLMTLMALATIAVIVVLSVSCMPLKKLWDPTVPGTCLDLTTVYYVAYVQSGFTIVIDLCLSAAPILILWNVKIQRGRKSLICCLLSLGLVATISNALRNDFQTELTTSDMTYNMTGVTVVAILELSSGIIAACIPACMPLWTWRKQKIGSTTKDRYDSRNYMNMKDRFSEDDKASSSKGSSSSVPGDVALSQLTVGQPPAVHHEVYDGRAMYRV